MVSSFFLSSIILYVLLLLCRNFLALDENLATPRQLPTTSIASEVDVSDGFQVRLQQLASRVLIHTEGMRFKLHVRRQHALTDALDVLELVTAEDLFKPINVVFLGESAIDDGGPTREFTSLIVVQCESSHLMEGL